MKLLVAAGSAADNKGAGKLWGHPCEEVREMCGFSKIRGYLFRGPNNKDYSILGFTLRSPDLGKLPYLHSWNLSVFVGLISRNLTQVFPYVRRPLEPRLGP